MIQYVNNPQNIFIETAVLHALISLAAVNRCYFLCTFTSIRTKLVYKGVETVICVSEFYS